MSYLKKQISIILISLTVLGCVNTQAITIPLKLNSLGQLAISVSYGTKQCNIDAAIYTNGCSSSIIGGFGQEEENCGVEPAEEGKYVRRAPFQLRDFQAILSYEFSPRYISNFLCLGHSTNQNNILVQLFQSGKIKEKSESENGSIGQIDIGVPNKSLIAKDNKMVELEKIEDRNTYTTPSLKGIEFLGEPLAPNISNYAVSFSQFQPYIQVEFTSLPRIPSIEKLKPLKISLLQKDGRVFTITLQPSQYTRRLSDGGYQLMMASVERPNEEIILGYTVFESYYVGFNQEGQQTVIAKKALQSPPNNFRGSFNVSE